MRYITGDTHFFHRNIIDYCYRPFRTVEEMNAVIEANWNALVSPEDEVWVLGDFAFIRGWEFEVQRLFDRLTGRKILVKGNHDKAFTMSLGWERVILPTHNEPAYEILDGVVLTHDADELIRNHPEFIDEPVYSAHVHDRWKFKAHILNVGVDCWHFRPVGWNDAYNYWTYHSGYYRSEKRRNEREKRRNERDSF